MHYFQGLREHRPPVPHNYNVYAVNISLEGVTSDLKSGTITMNAQENK